MLCRIILIISVLWVSACTTAPKLVSYPSSERALAGDFWIGDMGPIHPRSELQYPFVCSTEFNGLGQPLIDNKKGIGNAVFPTLFGVVNYFASPDGYSQYCGIPTRVDYYYYSLDKEKFLLLDNPRDPPRDVEKITVNGEIINFIVRAERGTLNRFLYSIAMLAPYRESARTPRGLNNDAWNGKLVYKFAGGVGLGHWQGNLPMNDHQALHYESLKRGYAVAFSSGTATMTHYNLNLAAETAWMLKQHFSVVYGPPEHTIGIGASGGAISQYVMGQYHPGLIDAAIPQASFPDMVSQTIYVADCDLLERYFDQRYQRDPNSKWGDWLFRAKVLGLSARNYTKKSASVENPYEPQTGGSICSRGWRGEIPKTFNPNWAPSLYMKALEWYRFPKRKIRKVKWTHWNDLPEVYPQDEKGYAANSWDNVGVQYGLRALIAGDITVDDFLKINACVGGWKAPQKMRQSVYPWTSRGEGEEVDPWDQINMNLNADCETGSPAPRTAAPLAAVTAAFKGRQVFTGKIDIPIIDIRWYLDPVLDIHHALGSFAARARIERARGNSNNQVIWVAECNESDPAELNRHCDYEPTADALDVIERWLSELKQSPAKKVVAAKPDQAMDACFDHKGQLIYAGKDAWDGVLNQNPRGPCSQRFPVYPTSRMVAGEGYTGDIFVCSLKPVALALRDGTYGHVRFSTEEEARLQEVFPRGVCDYAKQQLALLPSEFQTR